MTSLEKSNIAKKADEAIHNLSPFLHFLPQGSEFQNKKKTIASYGPMVNELPSFQYIFSCCAVHMHTGPSSYNGHESVLYVVRAIDEFFAFLLDKKPNT